MIVSQYVGDQLVLVNAPDIYLADDGGVAVDMSREASLEMQSEPGGDSTTPSRWSWFPCSRQAAWPSVRSADQLASSPYCGGGGDHRSELRQCVRRLSLIRRTGGVRSRNRLWQRSDICRARMMPGPGISVMWHSRVRRCWFAWERRSTSRCDVRQVRKKET
ncbi:peptidase U35, phage prohead HK97 [Escherichia coli]|nr:peptidase U35, phage prohead HK97 [Escherichia coli]